MTVVEIPTIAAVRPAANGWELIAPNDQVAILKRELDDDPGMGWEGDEDSN